MAEVERFQRVVTLKIVPSPGCKTTFVRVSHVEKHAADVDSLEFANFHTVAGSIKKPHRHLYI
jgi:hypothetical protein